MDLMYRLDGSVGTVILGNTFDGFHMILDGGLFQIRKDFGGFLWCHCWGG